MIYTIKFQTINHLTNKEIYFNFDSKNDLHILYKNDNKIPLNYCKYDYLVSENLIYRFAKGYTSKADILFVNDDNKIEVFKTEIEFNFSDAFEDYISTVEKGIINYYICENSTITDVLREKPIYGNCIPTKVHYVYFRKYKIDLINKFLNSFQELGISILFKEEDNDVYTISALEVKDNLDNYLNLENDSHINVVGFVLKKKDKTYEYYIDNNNDFFNLFNAATGTTEEFFKYGNLYRKELNENDIDDEDYESQIQDKILEPLDKQLEYFKYKNCTKEDFDNFKKLCCLNLRTINLDWGCYDIEIIEKYLSIIGKLDNKNYFTFSNSILNEYIENRLSLFLYGVTSLEDIVKLFYDYNIHRDELIFSN